MKKLKQILKDNRKTIVAFVVGLLLASTSVYAAATILFESEEVGYDNTKGSNLTSTNVQDALDELKTLADSCGSAGSFSLGDYFTLVPDASTYSVKMATTGYTADQTITPNELTLWRVIDIHSDGSVDAVSEYVSSTSVYFRGATGYANFVGGLQTIAQQYSKAGYTIDTRMMGYGGQTTTIPDISAFDGSTTTAPATSSTASPTSGTGQEFSEGVLGDTLYLRDYLLVKNVYSSDTSTYGSSGLKAYKVGTSTATIYWLASRRFIYGSAADFRFNGRCVNTSGGLGSNYVRNYNYSWGDNSRGYALRPIITLKSEITISGGTGIKTDPYTLS